MRWPLHQYYTVTMQPHAGAFETLLHTQTNKDIDATDTQTHHPCDSVTRLHQGKGNKKRYHSRKHAPVNQKINECCLHYISDAPYAGTRELQTE